MLLKEIAVQLFEHLIDHDWHGYSQVSRWGDGEGVCPITISGKTYNVEQGDRDCSSGIISAFEAAGVSCGGATYTGNMRNCMTRTGNFKWHPMSSGYIAKRGDVYLNHVNHTALCLDDVPDILGEFSISETGGIDGAEGDQTGRESGSKPYYNYPWDGILECVCTKTDGVTQTPKPITAKAEIRPQTGMDEQRIYFEDAGDGYVRLKSKKTGLYLDVPSAKAVNGAVLQWYPRNNTDAQLWKIIWVTQGHAKYLTLAPKLAQDKRVSVESNGINGGVNLKLWNDMRLKESKQNFWIKRAADGTYVLVHTYSLKAITAA